MLPWYFDMYDNHVHILQYYMVHALKTVALPCNCIMVKCYHSTDSWRFMLSWWFHLVFLFLQLRPTKLWISTPFLLVCCQKRCKNWEKLKTNYVTCWFNPVQRRLITHCWNVALIDPRLLGLSVSVPDHPCGTNWVFTHPRMKELLAFCRFLCRNRRGLVGSL